MLGLITLPIARLNFGIYGILGNLTWRWCLFDFSGAANEVRVGCRVLGQFVNEDFDGIQTPFATIVLATYVALCRTILVLDCALNALAYYGFNLRRTCLQISYDLKNVILVSESALLQDSELSLRDLGTLCLEDTLHC